jgi:uncharacterized membrane protein YbhN (UPF0104 family)
VLGLFAMLGFSAVMLVPNLTLVTTYPKTIALAVAILGMFSAAAGLLLVSLRSGLSQFVPGLRTRLRKLPKADVLERGLGACRALGRNPRLFVQTLLISVLLTVVCVFQLLALVWGYGIEVPWSPMFLVVPAVICISALPVTPNGLGVRDNLYLYLLSLPEIGIRPNTAVAISLVAYAGSLVWSVVGGLLYVFMRRKSDLTDADKGQD